MSVAEYAAQFPSTETESDYANGRRFEASPPRMNVSARAPARSQYSANPLKFACGVELKPRDDLSPEEFDFVPKYDFDWEISETEIEKWEFYAVAVAERENVLDVGPTGCGKTAGLFQFAATLNQPVIRFNLSGDARVAQFVGEKSVEIDPDTKQAVVVWKDGILTRAMRNGWWLVLDELDACPPQILFVLHGVLEKDGQLTIAENGGEKVSPHPDFRVFSAANTIGRGDESGAYEGTQILNEAFLDRFGVVLDSDYQSEDVEVKILVAKTGVPKNRAMKMRRVAAKVRDGLRNRECECTFSTRRLIAWASKSRFLGAVKAAQITVLNKLSADDRTFVADIVQRHFGGDVQR
jgi:cobaltochelatase CobS